VKTLKTMDKSDIFKVGGAYKVATSKEHGLAAHIFQVNETVIIKRRWFKNHFICQSIQTGVEQLLSPKDLKL
jgi:hypothetical protein